jgi:hypothetical protein
MGAGNRFELGVSVKLLNHSAHVAANRRVANPELIGNVSIAETGGEQFQYFVLSTREPTEEHSPLRTNDFLAMAAVGQREHVRHRLKELHVVAGEVTS